MAQLARGHGGHGRQESATTSLDYLVARNPKAIANILRQAQKPHATLEQITQAQEVISEYSRLRSIAGKRLKRFEKSAEFSQHPAYLRNVGKYQPIKTYGKNFLKEGDFNITSFSYELTDLVRFVEAKTSSISGIKSARHQAVKALREEGYTWINAGNIKQFGEFMKLFKASAIGRVYDSARAVQAFKDFTDNKRKNKSVKTAFERWSKETKRGASEEDKRKIAEEQRKIRQSKQAKTRKAKKSNDSTSK